MEGFTNESGETVTDSGSTDDGSDSSTSSGSTDSGSTSSSSSSTSYSATDGADDGQGFEQPGTPTSSSSGSTTDSGGDSGSTGDSGGSGGSSGSSTTGGTSDGPADGQGFEQPGTPTSSSSSDTSGGSGPSGGVIGGRHRDAFTSRSGETGGRSVGTGATTGDSTSTSTSDSGNTTGTGEGAGTGESSTSGDSTQFGPTNNGEGGAMTMLESRILENNPHLDKEDVDVVFTEDGAQARLTASGAEAQFLNQNPEYQASDIGDVKKTGDSWSVEFTAAGRQSWGEQNLDETDTMGSAPDAAQLLESRQGQDASVVFNQGVEAGEGLLADRARQAEANILEDNPGLDPSDVTVDFNPQSGQFEPTLTEQGRFDYAQQQADRMREFEDAGATQPDNVFDPEQEAAVEEPQTVGEIGGDATTTADRELQEGEVEERARQQVRDQLENSESELARRLEAQGVDPENVAVNTELTSGGVEVDLRRQDTESAEQFGDFAVRLPGGSRLEDALGDASDWITGGIEDNAELGGKTLRYTNPGYLAQELATRKAESLGVPVNQGAAAANVEKEAETFSENVFVGAASLVDVPGVALGVKEGAEFAGWAGVEAAQGHGGEVAAKSRAAATRAGEGFWDSFTSNPTKVSGQVVGSLVGSVGVLGGASRVSSGLGKAARYSIQPGEEIVSAGATGLARRSARASRYVDKLPNGKIDNEELALAGAQQGARAVNTKFVSPALRAQRRARERVRARTPSRSDVLDRVGPSDSQFVVDERTGDLMRTRTFRPGVVDPQTVEVSTGQVEVESDTDTDAFDGGDWEPPRDFEGGGSTDAGSNVLSGATVEVDAGNGMKNVLQVERRTNVESETVNELEAPTQAEIEVEWETESGTGSQFGRPAEVNTQAAAADTLGEFGFGEEWENIFSGELSTETSQEGFQSQETEPWTGFESEVDTEQKTEMSLEEIFGSESALRQESELESETELGLEWETESETETEMEALWERLEQDEEKKGPDFGVSDEVFDTGVVQDLDKIWK